MPFRISPGSFSRSALLALCVAVAAPASATSFVLTYSGTLHAADTLTATGGSADLIAADTPFTLSATFDTAGPNLVAPLPRPGVGNGFAAYAPSQASITIGGATYDFTGLGGPTGLSVALFDRSNVIFPGRYGVGMIVNPLADGAGFIGDFLSASTDFTVGALTSTTFQNYAGAGVSPGVGCGPNQSPCRPTPIALIQGGRGYSLLFAGDRGTDYDGGFATAAITAVPEPATWSLLLLGFGAAGCALRRGRAVSPAAC